MIVQEKICAMKYPYYIDINKLSIETQVDCESCAFQRYVQLVNKTLISIIKDIAV